MALQTEAIEDRLEGLKLDDRRNIFDSQIRAIRTDSQAAAASGGRRPKPAKPAEPEPPIGSGDRLCSKSSPRRIDGLEKKTGPRRRDPPPVPAGSPATLDRPGRRLAASVLLVAGCFAALVLTARAA